MPQYWDLVDGKVTPSTETGRVHIYVNPTPDERRYLVDTLKLDEHTLMCSLDPDELARVETEPEHMALIFKRPRNYSSSGSFEFRVDSTGVFLFADKVIVVLAEELPVFQGKPFAKVTSLPELVLKLIYGSIIHFVEHLRVVNAVSESLEDQINTSMQNKYLINLFSLEKSLVYYLNAINSNGKLIDRLKNSAPKLGFTPENIEFIDDLIIENHQCYEQAETYSSILASMMDARVSIVSNNLNWLMKTLNIITIGIMFPNLIVSIFSMNVDFPGREHPFAFWFILCLAALSIISVPVLMWWKKW